MIKIENLIYPLAVILGIVLIVTPEYDVHISFLFWVALMFYCMLNIEKRVLLMLFAFTVFVFCMTRIVIPEYYINDFIQDSQLYSMSFSQDVHNFVARACFLSLVGALVGFNLVSANINSDYRLNIDPNSYQITQIRKISKYLYLLSVILVVYSIYTRFSFVAAYGYMDSYIDYSNSLPTVLSKFASTNALCFYLFLVTLPSKKEAKPILIVFMLVAVFSLLTGARTGFIMSLITLLVYLLLRNRIDPYDPWLTRKVKIAILFSLPFITALMFIVMLMRGESSVSNISFVDMVINSIYQQGSILEVLGVSYENADRIPYRIWSFGRVIDSYDNNFLFQILGIGQAFKANTVDFAINGHSLANYLTYTYQTQRYLAGGGMGSSFIAESWLDFGYLGVVGFSVVYGVILSKFFVWARKNVWIFAISFYMVNAIIYVPRAGAADFVSDILSPTYLLLLIGIYFYTKPKTYV